MDCNFGGGSMLLSPTGDLLAKAKSDEEDLIVCEVDYRDMKAAETFIPTLKDLQPELFDELKRQAKAL